MNLLAKQRLKDSVIYLAKAFVFAVGSYLLIYVIYGGIRISFPAWAAIVLLAFAVAYIPYLLRKAKDRKRSEKSTHG